LDLHQNVIERICALFVRDGAWPTWEIVDHDLDVELSVRDPWKAIAALDTSLLWGVGAQVPSSRQEVGLTLAGLLRCAEAHEDVDLFVRAVREGVDIAKATAPPEEPKITPSLLAERLGVGEPERVAVLDRQIHIWRTAGQLWTSLNYGEQTGSGTEWSVNLNRQFARTLRGRVTASDLVEALHSGSAEPVQVAAGSESNHLKPASGPLAIVFVHGLFSSPKTWNWLEPLVADLPGITTYLFEYPSPWLPRLTRRVPSHEQVADALATFLRVTVQEPEVVLITHSQGGLVALHFVERSLLSADNANDLPRVRMLFLYACPNGGSDFGRDLRRRYLSWNAQERGLRPLDEQTAEVMRRVVYAVSQTSPPQLELEVVAVVGASDGIVTPASARGNWPTVETVFGDHSTIIRPDSKNDQGYRVLEEHLRRITLLPIQTAGAPELVNSDSAEYWRRRADEFSRRLPLDNWDGALGGLVSSSLRVPAPVLTELRDFASWVVGSNFPEGFDDIRRALETTGRIAADLVDVLDERVESVPGSNWLRVPGWYRLAGERYHAELGTYHTYVDLVTDLTFELTRATEWFCDLIREHVEPGYRLDEGGLMLEGGPYEDGNTRRWRVRYSPSEHDELPAPYVDLSTFRDTARYRRDLHTKTRSSQSDH